MAGEVDGMAAGSGQERPAAAFDQLIPARIHKISDLLEEVARIMLGDTHGLGFTETRILAYLAENGSASVIDISRDLRVDKAWISRRLSALVSKRLIAKQPDGSDSRAILASLTDEGKLAADRTMDIVRKTYTTIVDGVDEKVASDIITVLEANIQTILSQLRSA